MSEGTNRQADSAHPKIRFDERLKILIENVREARDFEDLKAKLDTALAALDKVLDKESV